MAAGDLPHLLPPAVIRADSTTSLSRSKIGRFSVGADLCVCPGGWRTLDPGQTHRSAPTLILDLLSLSLMPDHGHPTEVVSTLTGRNTPSGPRRNQTARLLPLPFENVTLKALVTRPGWKTVVWPRF